MTKKQLVEVIGSGEKTYLYFFAEYCSACKSVKWLVERERTKLYQIDGEANQELTEAFDIQYYPTIIEINGTKKRTYEGTAAVKNLLK